MAYSSSSNYRKRLDSCALGGLLENHSHFVICLKCDRIVEKDKKSGMKWKTPPHGNFHMIHTHTISTWVLSWGGTNPKPPLLGWWRIDQMHSPPRVILKFREERSDITDFLSESISCRETSTRRVVEISIIGRKPMVTMHCWNNVHLCIFTRFFLKGISCRELSGSQIKKFHDFSWENNWAKSMHTVGGGRTWQFFVCSKKWAWKMNASSSKRASKL